MWAVGSRDDVVGRGVYGKLDQEMIAVSGGELRLSAASARRSQ